MREHFELEEVAATTLDPAGSDGTGVFGYIDAHHRRGFRLRLKDAAAIDEALGDRSEAYRRLDAVILEELILKRTLGLRTRTSPPSAGSATRRASPRRSACSTRAPTKPPSCFAPRRSSRCARSRPTARRCPPSPPTLLPEGADGSGVQSTELMKIYTRKGDDGTTSLWYGGRVAKTDARTEAYGALDEAGAALGVARSLCGPDDAELAADLLGLQRQLFVAGAELATAPEAAGRLRGRGEPGHRRDGRGLEPIIDRYMERVDLPPKFVLPAAPRSPPNSTSPAPRSAARSGAPWP